LPGFERGRRRGAATDAVRVGQRRFVPRLLLDVHHDRGVGVAARPITWRVNPPVPGTIPIAGRVTPTSDGRGHGNCFGRRLMPLYGLGGPGRKSRPPPNVCSPWPHEC